VIVLGHSHCGAVKATVDTLRSGDTGDLSPNLVSIVDSVAPAVHSLLEQQNSTNEDELIQRAVNANVQQSVNNLHKHSQVLSGMVERNEIKIIGAEYSIDAGIVDFHSDL